MKYQGLSGVIYEVEEKRIAGGGEGNIHAVIGNDEQVAKIFKENKRDACREEKLRLMIQEKLSDWQLRQVTWPQDVIYDQNGFAGYIMPKLVNSSSLTELYTEEKYDLRYRLLAAINLCAAIDTVHQMGQVCGDLNPQNIFVNLDKNDRKNGFRITLVDTDSYHFVKNGSTYRCDVGLGEFIAPELQNKMSAGCDLKTVPLPSYSRETDLFALAVHIFYLLMNGCHPFACAKDAEPGKSNIGQMAAGKAVDSNVCPQPIENIKNGFFPFYEKRQGVVIPVYAPEFESLPAEVRSMFIRTFVDGYREPSRRVTAAEWWRVLRGLLERIRQCSKVVDDYYFDHVAECPLCEIRRRLVPPPPPPVDPLPEKKTRIPFIIYGIFQFIVCISSTATLERGWSDCSTFFAQNVAIWFNTNEYTGMLSCLIFISLLSFVSMLILIDRKERVSNFWRVVLMIIWAIVANDLTTTQQNDAVMCLQIFGPVTGFSVLFKSIVFSSKKSYSD